MNIFKGLFKGFFGNQFRLNTVKRIIIFNLALIKMGPMTWRFGLFLIHGSFVKKKLLNINGLFGKKNNFG